MIAGTLKWNCSSPEAERRSASTVPAMTTTAPRTARRRAGRSDLVDALLVQLEQPLVPLAGAGLRDALARRRHDNPVGFVAAPFGARGQVEHLADRQPGGRRLVVPQVADELVH